MEAAGPGPDAGSTIEAARRGEREAQDEIVAILRGFSRHVCRGLAGGHLPELDWEDVAQEASHRFFTVGIERYRSGESGRSYLYAFAKRAYLHLSRGAWRRKRRDEAAEPPESIGEDPEIRTRLFGILLRLPERCRELLARVYFDGAPYGDLAVELGLAEGSVRARVSRCLGKARQIFV